MIDLDEVQTERLLTAIENCIEDPFVALERDKVLMVLSQYFSFPAKYAVRALGTK